MVETNTMAASMGGHCEGVARMHQHFDRHTDGVFVQNNVIETISKSIAKAVIQYGQYFGKKLDHLCVVFVTEYPG